MQKILRSKSYNLTDSQLKIVKSERAKRKTIKFIAAMFNMEPETLRQAMIRKKLYTGRFEKVFTAKLKKRAVHLRMESVSLNTIAAEIGISRDRVKRYLDTVDGLPVLHKLRDNPAIIRDNLSPGSIANKPMPRQIDDETRQRILRRAESARWSI